MEIRNEDRDRFRQIAADVKAIRELLERREERENAPPDSRQQGFAGMPPRR